MDRVLKVLAEERLEQFADRLQTSILEGKQGRVSGSHAGDQQDKYDNFLHTHEKTFQAFLGHSGLADKFDVQDLADKGTDVHVACNTQIQASDAQLRKDAEKMRAFVNMLSEDMPYECALVTHFDWVAKNLCNL